jgi:hypothetical protein
MDKNPWKRGNEAYTKPHIDLHDILQRRQGERDCQKKVYWRNGHRRSMSVAINAKGGDCWKVGCH